ncbi:putative short chain dehydrogenase/ reductase [Hypomontagnella monticulosa]|nr:putative short chain dehydrogenase/ reductase [Hypomontagnella monticulosa]
MPPIKGQHVLVIGGSTGIGLAVAQLAASEGLVVSLASSNQSRVSAAVSQIQASVPGAAVAGYVCDVNTDDAESNLEQLFADVVRAASGRQLDHVVYTAVTLDVRPVSEVSAGYLRDSVQFAYVVPLLIGKLAPRYVRGAYTSSLTLTSGRLGQRPLPGMSVPSGWGASLFGTMRGLALDLAPIRVNLVSPGLVDTRLINEWRDQLTAMAKASLLGKIGTPEEVAEAYIYLMKDTNATGSAVSTNGGALVQ